MNLPAHYWQISVISQALIVPVMVWWVRGSLRTSWRTAIITGLVLVAWFAAVFLSASLGFLDSGRHLVPWIGVPVAAPVVIAVFMLRRRQVSIAHDALVVLMALQFMRITGGEFILAYYEGFLPAHFGLAAGWGDVATGVAAPFVALLAYYRVRHWRQVAYAWNIFGILDLVNAVTLGVITAPGPLRLVMGDPSTGPMTLLPLSLIPTFGVPLAVIGHLLALHALRQTRESD